MKVALPGGWRAAAPGAALTIALAAAAKFASTEIETLLSNPRVPTVSPVLLGVLLGMLWRQFAGLRPSAVPGTEWVLGTLLRIGVALVGLRLTVNDLAHVGSVAAPAVIACIASALLVSTIVGRMLGLSSGLRRLLAVGSAVCGCTAIIATAPAIRAHPRDTGAAIVCVVLLGSAGMVLYPWLGAKVFADDPLLLGVFLGSAIHDTSQVVGASLIAAQLLDSPDIVGFASAAKLLRNTSIIVLVPALAWCSREHLAPPQGGRVSAAVPSFVIWFVALAMARSAGDHVSAFDPALQRGWLLSLDALRAFSELLMIGGMTALGLNLSLPEMLRTGWRPLGAALLVALATGACSLGIIYTLT